MEAIWQYIFDQLKVELNETNVMLPSLPLERMQDETISQIMFEVFDVAAIDLVLEPMLVLCSHGTTSGTVYHMGHGTSYIAPIYSECCIRNGVQYCPISGEDITKILSRFIDQRVFENNNLLLSEEYTLPFSSLDNMKKNVCYVAENYQHEMQSSSSIKYYDIELEKKKYHIGIGKERFQCYESVFNPSTCGYSGIGIHEMIIESISSYPEKYHQSLSNIYISGGGTLVHGFTKRLQKELNNLNLLQCNIYASENRDLSTWIGGSVLGCLRTHSWWTKDDYIESGNRKWSIRYDVDLGTGDLMETLLNDQFLPLPLKGPTPPELIFQQHSNQHKKDEVREKDDKNKNNDEKGKNIIDNNVQQQQKSSSNNNIDNNNNNNNQKKKETPSKQQDSCCTRCNTTFHIFKKRHYCRKCNLPFCNNCSSGREIIKGLGPKPVRVCLNCVSSSKND